ncbi:MAG: hypothetical protein WAV28_03630 [Sedimentisphaerales bacterium]
MCVQVAEFVGTLVRVAVGDIVVGTGTSVGLAFPQPLSMSNTNKVKMVFLTCLNIFRTAHIVIKALFL